MSNITLVITMYKWR